MLLITCPWCGAREETEFHCGGEAHIVRPKTPSALSDDEWADYLFMRKNLRGVQLERWRHDAGCGRWFNAARDSVSDRFLAVYKMEEACPPLPGDAAGSGVAGSGAEASDATGPDEGRR